MMPEPGIYTGVLRHRRFQPVSHAFEYPLFMVLLDIDRIEETLSRSRLSSVGRWNWASFYSADHFGDPGEPLRERLRADAASCGLRLPDGPIFLLTQLRYLGYCFNPISFYYCYDSAGELGLILAEVNSTFGESVNYWLHPGNRFACDPSGDPRSPAFHYRTGKRLHVSPFMGMDMEYEFTLTPPVENLVAHLTNIIPDGGRPFDATLKLDRIPWTARNLRRTLMRFPWMTAKTILAIHFEAVRLFLKRAPFYRHPGSYSGHSYRPHHRAAEAQEQDL